jgi:hypothetical protein
MRAFSELLGKILLWFVILWLGAIMVMPKDLRPVLACEPVVWLTRSLGEFVGSAAGTDHVRTDNAEAVGSFARGCMRVMTRYFDGGAARS